MGARTLTLFRDQLRSTLKNRDDLATTDILLDQDINDAYLHLCQPEVHKFKEMQTTYDFSLVTGTDTYPLDSVTVGFYITGVRDATYYEATTITPTAVRRDLSPRQIQWFNRRANASGPPRSYVLDGNNIILHGVPSSAENGYQVRLTVWTEPALLSADTDTTTLPSYWDQVIALGAQWKAEYRLGYRELALATKQEYVSMINEKADDFELTAEDTDHVAELRTVSAM